ncbi:MAG: hypothetical protein K9L28_09235 [Synergistales bacterium]|nr:hypothetical protein [Synergistales bacterium]
MRNCWLNRCSTCIATFVTVLALVSCTAGTAAAVPGDPFSRDHTILKHPDLIALLEVSESATTGLQADYVSPDRQGGSLTPQWRASLTPGTPVEARDGLAAAVGTRSPDHPMIAAGMAYMQEEAGTIHFHLTTYHLDAENKEITLAQDYNSGINTATLAAFFHQDKSISACDWTGDGTSDYACAVYANSDRKDMGYFIMTADGDPATPNHVITTAISSSQSVGATQACLDTALLDVTDDGRKELLVLAKEQDGHYNLRAFQVESDLTCKPLEGDPYTVARYDPDDWTNSCALSPGDSDGDGTKELVAGYTTGDGGTARLKVLEPADQQDGVAWTSRCKGQITPGDGMEDSHFPMRVCDLNGDGREEFVFAAAGPSLHIAGVGSDGSSIVELADRDVPDPGTSWRGLALATGAFTLGFTPWNPESPPQQIALYAAKQVNQPSDGRLWLYEPTLDEQGGITGVDELSEERWKSAYDYGVLLPGDFAGDALRLGPPTKITVENHITPLVVMREPPKHLDYTRSLDAAGWDKCNITRSTFYYTQFLDKQTSEKIVTTRQQTSNSFGRTFSSTQQGSLNLGVAEVSAKAKESFGKSWSSRSSSYHRSYDETTTQISARTTKGDMVSYRCQDMDIYRYPVIGDTGSPGQTYYQVVIPEPTRTHIATGRDLTWYQPPHIPGNLLTYPWKKELPGTDPQSADLLGGDTTYELGNAVTWDVSWTHSVASGDTTRTSVENSNTESFSTTLKGKGEYLSGELKAGVTFTHDHCSAQSTSNRNSITETSGFTVALPSFPGSELYAYDVTPLVYSTDMGNLAATYLADITARKPQWWIRRYGGAPNPALGLPHQWYLYKFSKPTEEDEWRWNATGADRDRLQGMFFLDSTGKKRGHALNKDATGMDKPVRIRCRIYNLAVQNAGTDVSLTDLPVRFSLSGDHLRGGAQTIGTDHVDIAPYGNAEAANWSWAEVNWALADVPEGSYRILVEADPDDTITELPHHDNGDLYSDNRGWFEVYVHEGAGNPGTAAHSLHELDGALEVSPDRVDPGGAVTIEADIHNPGSHSATRVFVAFAEGTTGDTIAHRLIPGIAPGDTHHLTVRHFPAGAGRHSVTMAIDDSEHELAEVSASYRVGTDPEGGCTTGDSPWALLVLLPGVILPAALRKR